MAFKSIENEFYGCSTICVILYVFRSVRGSSLNCKLKYHKLCKCLLLVAFQRKQANDTNIRTWNFEYLAFNHALKILNWYYNASGSGWWWQQNHSDSYKQVTYPISHYFLFKMLVALFSLFLHFLLCLVFRSFGFEFDAVVLVVVFMFCFLFFSLLCLWDFFHLLLRIGVTSCHRICMFNISFFPSTINI